MRCAPGNVHGRATVSGACRCAKLPVRPCVFVNSEKEMVQLYNVPSPATGRAHTRGRATACASSLDCAGAAARGAARARPAVGAAAHPARGSAADAAVHSQDAAYALACAFSSGASTHQGRAAGTGTGTGSSLHRRLEETATTTTTTATTLLASPHPQLSTARRAISRRSERVQPGGRHVLHCALACAQRLV